MGLESALKVWNQLEPLLKEGKSLDLTELYDSLVGEYRPIIQAMPELAEKLITDLNPVIIAGVKMLNASNKDPELKSLRLEGTRLKASLRAGAIEIYQKAGFTREEAICFILQDIVASQVLSNTLRQTASAQTKKN